VFKAIFSKMLTDKICSMPCSERFEGEPFLDDGETATNPAAADRA
jgi:hypothetical protein